MKPNSSSFFARKDQKDVPADFNPYRALFKMKFFPCSGPNSEPALIQTIYKLGAWKKVFCTSAPNKGKSFNAAIINMIHTESLDTTVL